MGSRNRVPKSLRNELLAEAGGRCAICQGHGVLEFHHIDLDHKEGPQDVDHLILLCPGCHSRLHLYSPEELRAILHDSGREWMPDPAHQCLAGSTSKVTSRQISWDALRCAGPATQQGSPDSVRWKQFEKLVADLLEAEGFRVLQEPSVDRSGIDILAEETVPSHSGLEHRVRWLVQCKDYARGKRNLGRRETEEILGCFQVKEQDALLIVVNTDITEDAIRVIEEYKRGAPLAKRLIKIWNRRELENRLLRHPAVARKYGLAVQPSTSSLCPFGEGELAGKSVLVVSDTSPFAYQLFTCLNRATPNTHMVTLWQYGDPVRCKHLVEPLLRPRHDLVVFFLGDSFGFPVPSQLTQKIVDTVRDGGAVLLFPFFAWALAQGAYSSLNHLVPVRLVSEQRREQSWLKALRMFSVGDISWLNPEAFIENQSAVIPVVSQHPALAGVTSDVSIIHTYEFLDVTDGSKCVLSDSQGTPFLVTREASGARIAYLNSCTHNCFTAMPILCPFEVSEPYRQLVANTVRWCLGIL
ncbi:MAG: hypothetical protein FJ291_16970 [Planctomycetes bacterium]|nr:hypothetical protein [Planctomycetota bacterium]